MNYGALMHAFEWSLMFYFIGLNVSYMMLNIVSFFTVHRYMQQQTLAELPLVYAGFELPISMLVPAYNEEANIVATVQSLLQLNYPEFEIVVINDGSKDNTLLNVIDYFSMKKFPEAYRVRIKTKNVKAIYHSPQYPNLRVIDKYNGGKADALNVGINCSRYPLFTSVDGDSVLQKDSLLSVVQPFMDDTHTVASGGTVRIVNGCEVQNGFVTKIQLPTHFLALLQVLEYLRAFLFGRLGWTAVNAVMIIPGAFGVFHKETVVSVGGYKTATIGEDMELVVRMHRILSASGKPYRIQFVPNPICWTEAPEDFKTLKNQRVRWQQGLCESLFMNRQLLFSRRGGAVGWLAFPFFTVFEVFGPLLEAAGYVFIVISFAAGVLNYTYFILFFVIAIGLGMVLSMSALLLEEMSFHIYPKFRHVLLLCLAAVVENFGYRQLNTYWRVIGIVRWISGKKGQWGVMQRKAAPQTAKRVSEKK